ncbi:uncharacterized protein METZ01_LOCUS353069, partial [marine metagenome]
MKEPIGEKIYRLRKKMNLTQKKIHKNQSQVALIEKGKKKGGIANPSENTLVIIAKNLGLTLDELIEETTWEKPEAVMEEIAVSPKAWDIKIDDTGDIKWSCKIYDRYNENGEEN